MIFFRVILFKLVILVLGVLISVAFITLIERKILGLVGIRLSPIKVSLFGTLQPITDALKLALKIDVSLSISLNIIYIVIGPAFLSFSLSVWIFSGIFFSNIILTKLSLLVVLFLITFRTLRVLLLGWVSLSKYPIIGSIRSATQAISYESIIIIVFLIFCYLLGSFKFNQDVVFRNNIILMAPVLFIFWLFTSLAELGRTPYDFSEGERELVSGFNTEFGSRPFSLIFLSEYSNILFFSSLTSIIFFFSFNVSVIISLLFWFIWIRSVLPRSRFDHLIDLAWKFFIPIVTCYLILFLVSLSF